MTSDMTSGAQPRRVRIPADVEREDRVLAGLTARQLAILATTGLLLWAAYTATRPLLPITVFAAAALPVAAAAAAVALGRRDGVSLDRLAAAAARQALRPRRLVPAPDGVPPAPRFLDGAGGRLPAPLRLPAHAITGDGVIDLGADGAALVCRAGLVNFSLRTPAEQHALVAAYGRWLNSLTGPAQVLVRAQPVDLTDQVAALRHAAPGLPHPALEAAAAEHAAFLADLAARRDLLRRDALLVLREPANPNGRRTRRTPAGAGTAVTADQTTRLLRRADEAARALAAAGVGLTVLDAHDARAALVACCDPHTPHPPRPGRTAAPGDIITARVPRGAHGT